MRTASSLTLIAIGAIFAFAVTAHTSVLNLQIAGFVIMATGLAGLLLPRRGRQGWLRRRMILRRDPRSPVVREDDETRLPPYVMRNPAASAGENNGSQPGDLTAGEVGRQTIPDLPADDPPARQDRVAGDSPAAASEVVEEYTEE